MCVCVCGGMDHQICKVTAPVQACCGAKVANSLGHGLGSQTSTLGRPSCSCLGAKIATALRMYADTLQGLDDFARQLKHQIGDTGEEVVDEHSLRCGRAVGQNGVQVFVEHRAACECASKSALGG